jgi:hypothetical protein
METALQPVVIVWRVAAFLALAVSLGCTADPQLRINADPAADLSGYRTFGFMRPLGTDNPDATINSLIETIFAEFP